MKMSKIYFEANDDHYREVISTAIAKREELLDKIKNLDEFLVEQTNEYSNFLDIVKRDGVHDE